MRMAYHHSFKFDVIDQKFIDRAKELLAKMAVIEVRQRKIFNELGEKLGQERIQDVNQAIRNTREYRAAELKFLNFLNRHKKQGKIREALLDVWYTNVLSGMSTQARAIKGASVTSLMKAVSKVISTAIRHPRLVPQILRGYTRIGGVRTFFDIIKRGHPDLDYLGRKSIQQGFTAQLASESYLTIAKDPTRSIQDKVARSFAKTFLSIVYPMRIMIAFDTVLKRGLLESEAYVMEYERIDQEMDGAKWIEKKRELDRRMGLDQPSKQAIDAIIDSEMEKLDYEYFRKFFSSYPSRRRIELRNALRDAEIVLRANELAKKALLMNEPEGSLGEFYKSATYLTTHKKGDTWKNTTMRFVGQSLFPFMRTPTNLINMGLDFSVWGLTRMEFSEGARFKQKLKEAYTHEPNRLQVVQSLLGIGATYALYNALFDWDDDEETFKLNPDAPIEITAKGSGDYWENRNRDPNYKEYSWKIKRFDDSHPLGGYFSYVDNPLGFWFAGAGAVSDAIKYSGFKEEVKAKETGTVYDPVRRQYFDMAWASAYAALKFGSAQSYSQGLNQLMQIIDGSEEQAAKATAKRGSALFTPIVSPNFYKQIYGLRKSVKEKPLKEYYNPNDVMETAWKKIMKDIPMAEAFIAGYQYDQLGYPVIRRRELGMVPDIIMGQIVENINFRQGLREWQLIYKFDQVGLKKAKSPPQDIKSTTEFSQYQKMRGELFRQQINKMYTKLDKMGPLELQVNLNLIQSVTDEGAKSEWRKRPKNP